MDSVVLVIAAGLQLVAVGLFIWAIVETRKTTKATRETLDVAKRQLEENRETTKETISSLGTLDDILYAQESLLNDSKELTREIADLRQTTAVSQLIAKWDLPETRRSAVFAESLIQNGKSLTPENALGWWQIRAEGDLEKDKCLNIPRFYDSLNTLVGMRVIKEDIAFYLFGSDAMYYWVRFSNLIEALRSSDEYKRYSFDGFERYFIRVMETVKKKRESEGWPTTSKDKSTADQAAAEREGQTKERADE